jgi:hypothetical protein
LFFLFILLPIYKYMYAIKNNYNTYVQEKESNLHTQLILDRDLETNHAYVLENEFLTLQRTEVFSVLVLRVVAACGRWMWPVPLLLAAVDAPCRRRCSLPAAAACLRRRRRLPPPPPLPLASAAAAAACLLPPGTTAQPPVPQRSRRGAARNGRERDEKRRG